jgi:hypothetical protein
LIATEVYENNEFNCYQHNPEQKGKLIWKRDDAAKLAAKKELAEKIAKAEAEVEALKHQQAALA